MSRPRQMMKDYSIVVDCVYVALHNGGYCQKGSGWCWIGVLQLVVVLQRFILFFFFFGVNNRVHLWIVQLYFGVSGGAAPWSKTQSFVRLFYCSTVMLGYEIFWFALLLVRVIVTYF